MIVFPRPLARATLASSLALALATAPIGASAQNRYEQPPVLRASQILEPALYRSADHSVSERVENDGYMNHYTINSRYGAFECSSTAELEIRVHEVHAIAKLAEVDTSASVVKGVGAAGTQMVDGAGKILADPVGGLTGALSGVGALFGRAGDTLSGDAPEGQDDMLGFSKAKRKLAHAYGVSVYSSNTVLQAELDRVANATAFGSLALSGALAPVGGAAGIALTTTSATVKLNAIVGESSEADLNRANAAKLARMGVSQDLIDLFLDAPALTPLHQTAIVTALEAIGDAAGRSLVIKQAVLTGNEDMALFRTHQMAIYLDHDRRRAPIARFVAAGKYLIGIVDTSGLLLVALPVDYLAWTKAMAGIAMEAQAKLQQVPGVSARALSASGTVSPLAERSLQAMGWTVTQNAEAQIQ